MDAQIKNQGSNELAERIKNSQAEPQHRFELQDPFMDTTYRLPTAQAAVAQAEKLAASGFQAVDANNRYSQIRKVEGEWKREDGKSLADIQAGIDKESLRAIESRAELRAAAGQGVSAETEKEMATADAHAFRRIQGLSEQEDAAVRIASTARDNAEYKNSLDKAIPGYPGTAEKVYALDAANTDKVMAKEDRKAVEFASMAAETEAEKGVPMQSLPGKRMVYNDQPGLAGVEVVNEDGSITGFGGKPAIAQYAQENKLSPNDVAKMLEIDARADKYRTMSPRAAAIDAAAVAAMTSNTVEPNNEKAQQRLEGDEDAKRTAWLKKAEETKPAQPVGNTKAASDNKVESDEIFTASQADVKPAVPPEVEKQYLRVGDKFYHPNNTKQEAFEDKGNKLETKSNSENVAESMVRIAEARGWDEIKVSGTETFRKEVWLEAASRGMHVKGYAPSEQDKAELAKRTRELDPKIEKENKPFRARENEEEATTPSQRRANAFANETPADAVKLHPELAGAAAVLAATAKQAEADGLNPAQRAIVSARVRQNVVNSIERGELPAVKIKEEVEVKQDRKEEREVAR